MTKILKIPSPFQINENGKQYDFKILGGELGLYRIVADVSTFIGKAGNLESRFMGIPQGQAQLETKRVANITLVSNPGTPIDTMEKLGVGNIEKIAYQFSLLQKLQTQEESQLLDFGDKLVVKAYTFK